MFYWTHASGSSRVFLINLRVLTVLLNKPVELSSRSLTCLYSKDIERLRFYEFEMAKNFLGGENTSSVTQWYYTVIVLVLWFLNSKLQSSNPIINPISVFYFWDVPLVF